MLLGLVGSIVLACGTWESYKGFSKHRNQDELDGSFIMGLGAALIGFGIYTGF